MNETKRINWIDCAKLIAMIGVILRHGQGMIYESTVLKYTSYYAVPLFVILSGMSAWYSAKRSDWQFSMKKQLLKILSLFGSYAFAVLVYQIYRERFFDAWTYLQNLAGFNISGPFYFFVFYFQLVLISPVLIGWYRFCMKRKCSMIWNLCTIIVFAILGAIFVNFTYIHPAHGGSQYLFGGTFLLIFYLGIVFAGREMYSISAKCQNILGFASICCWILWLVLLNNKKLSFDQWLEPFWGSGSNPSGFNDTIFAIFTLFSCYFIFSKIDRVKKQWSMRLMKWMCVVGKSTLYIFMYHMLVMELVYEYVIMYINNGVVRFGGFLVTLLLPVMMKYVIERMKNAMRYLSNNPKVGTK